ncbi:MAG: hypothetical protein Q7T47_08340 [Anaerolineales bacterium]|nr:hypothetical protein [Anaerolineales bacterium]
MPPPSLLGPIALLGSGETSLSGGRIFESLAQNLPSPLRIVILETPAGFELNSSQVAGRVAEARRRARLRKDWAAADELRQQIESLGWRVDDTPDGLKFAPLLQLTGRALSE